MLKTRKTSEKTPSTGDVGEIAHRHGDRVAARLLAELRDHRLGGVDAVHLDAPLGERSASRPVPIASSSTGPSPASSASSSTARLLSEARVAVARRRRPRRCGRRRSGGRSRPPWVNAIACGAPRCSARSPPGRASRRSATGSRGRRASPRGRRTVSMYSRQAAIASGPAGSPWPGTTCSGSSAAMRSRNASQFSGGKPRVRFRWRAHADQVAGEQHALGGKPDDRVAGGVGGTELDRDGVRRGRARR